MNILHIIPSMDPNLGGTSQGLRNLIPELNKLGVHNELVCLDDPSKNFPVKDPFTIISLGPAKGPWSYSSKLVPWLLENIGRFDIIIVNVLWLYHGYAVTKAMKLYKKSVVDKGQEIKLPRLFIMPHGMLDPYFQQAPERKLKAIRNWAYWKLVENKLINGADGLLFTCQAELLLAREPFRPYHPNQEINIGYGTESPPPFEDDMTSAFYEKCPGVKDQSYFLFLSRVHEKKGIDLLIEAYSIVVNRIQEHKQINGIKALIPKLVVAGPGLDTPYGKKMQQMVLKSKTLQESVFFPGMISGKAKWGAFYGAEAFVLPSHQENFGIAVAESLACSKPVLISNKVNIWNEISLHHAGIIHDDSLDGTVNLITDFLSLTDVEKIKMGKQARLTYEQNFDVGVIAKRLVEAISK